MPRTVGHSRSTRDLRDVGSRVLTRGEPRPVHITLIATCQVYNSVVVIRGITPGLSPGYETRQTVESTFFQSRGTWAVAVVRLSRPRSTLGKEPNTVTVIEIKRATTTNRKQSKRSDFVTATVVKINQSSKFGKVQVQYTGEAGTRPVNLCTTRWRLPGVSEEGVCYINELNEIVMLKEPKSWKAIQRIDDPIIREKWNEASSCRAEIQGLREANTYKLVDRPSGVRCIPLVCHQWVFKIKQPRLVKRSEDSRLGVQVAFLTT